MPAAAEARVDDEISQPRGIFNNRAPEPHKEGRERGSATAAGSRRIKPVPKSGWETFG